MDKTKIKVQAKGILISVCVYFITVITLGIFPGVMYAMMMKNETTPEGKESVKKTFKDAYTGKWLSF